MICCEADSVSERMFCFSSAVWDVLRLLLRRGGGGGIPRNIFSQVSVRRRRSKESVREARTHGIDLSAPLPLAPFHGRYTCVACARPVLFSYSMFIRGYTPRVLSVRLLAGVARAFLVVVFVCLWGCFCMF